MTLDKLTYDIMSRDDFVRTMTRALICSALRAVDWNDFRSNPLEAIRASIRQIEDEDGYKRSESQEAYFKKLDKMGFIAHRHFPPKMPVEPNETDYKLAKTFVNTFEVSPEPNEACLKIEDVVYDDGIMVVGPPDPDDPKHLVYSEKDSDYFRKNLVAHVKEVKEDGAIIWESYNLRSETTDPRTYYRTPNKEMLAQLVLQIKWPETNKDCPECGGAGEILLLEWSPCSRGCKKVMP